MPALLEPAFLARLEKLRILSRRTRTRTGPGQHQGLRHGQSQEFSEHRDYVPGDDFRHLDWNAVGRLEKLFVKLFVEELELTLALLLDASASMACAGPGSQAATSKFDFGRRLAAALAYLTLCSGNRAALGLLRDRLVRCQGPVRGRSSAVRLFRFLEEAAPGGTTGLSPALRHFGARQTRPGVVVVISDFLEEDAGLEGLRFLRYQKNDLFCLQVLDPAEIEPSLTGDFRLVDAEEGSAREVSLSGALLRAYRQALQDHCRRLEDWCRDHGCVYVRAPAEADLESLLLAILRRGGLLR